MLISCIISEYWKVEDIIQILHMPCWKFNLVAKCGSATTNKNESMLTTYIVIMTKEIVSIRFLENCFYIVGTVGFVVHLHHESNCPESTAWKSQMPFVGTKKSTGEAGYSTCLIPKDWSLCSWRQRGWCERNSRRSWSKTFGQSQRASANTVTWLCKAMLVLSKGAF